MSKCNWIIAVALGLVLPIAFGVAGYQLGRGIGELRGEREAQSQNYAEHTGYQIQRSCFELDATAQTECIERIVDASNENQRAEKDLIAQSEMSTWAFWMLWATLVMAATTAFGVYFVWRTLMATQDMARETTRIGEAQVRAYVTIEDANIAPHPRQNHVSWEVDFIVRNCGQSPARRLRATVKIDNDRPVQGIIMPDLAAGHFCRQSILVTTNDFSLASGSDTDASIFVCVQVEFEHVFSKHGNPVLERADFGARVPVVEGEICKMKSIGGVLSDVQTGNITPTQRD